MKTIKRGGDTSIAEYARQGRDQVAEKVEAVKDATRELVDARADDVGDALDHLAHTLRRTQDAIEQVGEELGKRTGSAAKRVDRASKYLHKSDPDALFHDLQELSRRHVGLTMTVAFLAGMIAARITGPRG